MSTTKLDNLLGDKLGYVELVGSMGTDLTVVNAARNSYGKNSMRLSAKDKKLINYLARNKHTSPFRHVQLQFLVKAPDLVARQWMKHMVGAGFTDIPWNEISQRYVKIADEFYVPRMYRQQAAVNKQGSEGEVTACAAANLYYCGALTKAYRNYEELLSLGVAREQARAVLPFATYTTWVWTASLHACLHFIDLRNESHAQWEIRQYAVGLSKLVDRVAPYSQRAWNDAKAADVVSKPKAKDRSRVRDGSKGAKKRGARKVPDRATPAV